MNSEMYSNFPTEIDVFPIKTDLMYEQLPDARRYQELKNKSYLTESEQVELSDLVVRLKTSIWFCEDLNAISGGLTKLERYFRDNTIVQLNDWKQELAEFAADYEKLTYLMYQSWVTTTSKDYDIHAGNETLDPLVELTVDASANIGLTIDGDGVPYDKYTVVTNTSQKKTIIRFNSDYTITAGKRLEAKWQDTSGKVYSVSGHTHPANQVTGLAAIAISGKYSDLTGIPAQFTPSAHEHTWGQVTGKPTTYPATTHVHHDLYYTESEMNTKLAGKSDSGHKHTIADVSGLQGEIDTVKGDINGLKSSVSSGKNAIASAITAKGVLATGSDTHIVLANKIGQIDTGYTKYKGSGSIKRVIDSGTITGFGVNIPISWDKPIPSVVDHVCLFKVNTTMTNSVSPTSVTWKWTVGFGQIVSDWVTSSSKTIANNSVVKNTSSINTVGIGFHRTSGSSTPAISGSVTFNTSVEMMLIPISEWGIIL